MANEIGGWSAARASVPVVVFWLAACTVPETEGATGAAAADPAKVEPPVAVPSGSLRGGGANHWLERERGGRWADDLPASDIRTMVVTEAARQGSVPPALALAVAKVGSNIANRALGAAGAVGTMQIRPALADEFGADTDGLREPASNVRAGIACLAALQERYAGDWQLALSHFRGGPLKEADGTFAPHSFTRSYVRDVLRWWRLYRHDPLIGAWLRKMQGLPRFVASGSSVRRYAPIAVAATPAPVRTDVGGRWRAVADGRRFR